MTEKFIISTCVLAAFAVLAAGQTSASEQTNAELQSKVVALENRVDQLRSAGPGNLIIAPNTTLRFYGYAKADFMPIESYPGSLDFQGPAGVPFARVTQLRHTHEFGNGFQASASLENDPSGLSDRPAFTAAAS